MVSMISGGSELLMYRGEFDVTDEPLDKTIRSLQQASLSYPMEYGYSHVGKSLTHTRPNQSLALSLLLAWRGHTLHPALFLHGKSAVSSTALSLHAICSVLSNTR